VEEMVRLERGDDTQVAKAAEVLRPKVLRMFNAEAAVARPVLPNHLLVNVEQLRIGTVADGVDRDSPPRPVRPRHGLAQLVRRRDEDARAAGLVQIRLEHLGRARTERAIREALEAADSQPLVTKAAGDAEVLQLAPRAERPVQVDASGEFAAAGQPLV